MRRAALPRCDSNSAMRRARSAFMSSPQRGPWIAAPIVAHSLYAGLIKNQERSKGRGARPAFDRSSHAIDSALKSLVFRWRHRSIKLIPIPARFWQRTIVLEPFSADHFITLGERGGGGGERRSPPGRLQMTSISSGRCGGLPVFRHAIQGYFWSRRSHPFQAACTLVRLPCSRISSRSAAVRNHSCRNPENRISEVSVTH